MRGYYLMKVIKDYFKDFTPQKAISIEKYLYWLFDVCLFSCCAFGIMYFLYYVFFKGV